MATDIKEIIIQLDLHHLWIETIGEKGEKLGIDEIDLRDVDLCQYPLDQANITACTFDGMDLHDKDISSSLLCSSTFISANLEGADFGKSNVSYVNFTNADIKGARLTDSECIETVFVKADLSDANLVAGLFDGTDFREAILLNADIRLAMFERVLLNGAILTGICGIEEALIKSINIGTPEKPIMLMGKEARIWIQNNSLNKLNDE
ncbi:pentapeptide repeat-containing protein [Lysinibacillus sp. OF-1]|uniref:pentapeptide repeat-containing protein n=1 Tax=Lysinibacillus sp. OF-1 TaxID=2972483 RepID=UPI00232D1116|nr:pentapeptide repeat-containing protein [Lysinibacillus sp. OF-1]WCH46218.1 pentapeptide repeat-containing protein [Lysinibacillus sp. OF-1]